jgi:hypothetical protein
LASAPQTPKTRSSGSETRQRNHAVRVRLDDTERAQLETRAGARGLSLAAFMRACSLETAGPRARRRPPVDVDLLARTNADLNRVGNNVNQIAYHLNSGEAPEAVAVVAAMQELRGTLTVLRQALGYDRQG